MGKHAAYQPPRFLEQVYSTCRICQRGNIEWDSRNLWSAKEQSDVKRYSLSDEHFTELLAERGVEVDASCIWRWIQAYTPS